MPVKGRILNFRTCSHWLQGMMLIGITYVAK